jgi:hypothetical protein
MDHQPGWTLPNFTKFADYRAMKMHHVRGLAALLRKDLSKIPQFFKNSKEW